MVISASECLSVLPCEALWTFVSVSLEDRSSLSFPLDSSVFFHYHSTVTWRPLHKCFASLLYLAISAACLVYYSPWAWNRSMPTLVEKNRHRLNFRGMSAFELRGNLIAVILKLRWFGRLKGDGFIDHQKKRVWYFPLWRIFQSVSVGHILPHRDLHF